MGEGLSAEVMDPRVEFNSHGAPGTWKIPGVTEAVCSFTLGVTRPQKGSVTSLHPCTSCSLLCPLMGL